MGVVEPCDRVITLVRRNRIKYTDVFPELQ
jgi:hypothetical protein